MNFSLGNRVWIGMIGRYLVAMGGFLVLAFTSLRVVQQTTETLAEVSEQLVSRADDEAAERPVRPMATCEVRSIAASTSTRLSPAIIDPALAFLRRQLIRPPFASFRRFELLRVAGLRFERAEQARATMLANGRMLALSYLGRNHVDAERLRFRLLVEKSLPGMTMSIKAGATVLVCCDSLPDGSQQIVSLTCG